MVAPNCLAVTHICPAAFTIHSVVSIREAKPFSLEMFSSQSSRTLIKSPFFILSCSFLSSHGSGDSETWICSISERGTSSCKCICSSKILKHSPSTLECWNWQQNPEVEKIENEGLQVNPNFQGESCTLSNSPEWTEPTSDKEFSFFSSLSTSPRGREVSWRTIGSSKFPFSPRDITTILSLVSWS